MSKLAFSWDNTRVARADDKGVLKLYNVPELTQIWEAQALSPTLSLGWGSRENALIVSGHLDEICLWESVTGDLVRQITVEGRLHDISVSLDGVWVATYSDLEVVVVSLENPEERYHLDRTLLDNRKVRGVSILPQGPLESVLIATEGALWNWQPATGHLQSILAEPTRAARWSREGDLVAVGTESRLLLLDRSWQTVHSLAQGNFKAVAFNPGRRIVLACGKQLEAWRVDTGEKYATYRYSFEDLEVNNTGEYGGTSLGVFSMETGRGRTFWGQIDEMPTVRRQPEPAAGAGAGGGAGLVTWLAVLAALGLASVVAYHLVTSAPHPKPAKAKPRKHSLQRVETVAIRPAPGPGWGPA